MNSMQAHIPASDSLKNKYSLDDPRNPACLCHSYQALAEKEYKKLVKEEAVQIASILTSPANAAKPASYKLFGWKTKRGGIKSKRHGTLKKHNSKKALRAVACFKW